MNLCFDPDLASKVTLQPIDRFDLDAAILFADILLIPYAMGQNLSFKEGEGPVLDPVINPDLLDKFRDRDVLPTLEPVFETVRRTKAGLAPKKTLIGFAGAPWTVATYMLNGGSSKDPSALRERYYREPDFIQDLIDVLAEKTIGYLIAQIDAGADVIQIFDSWASGLPCPVLDAVSVGPMDKIAAAVKKARPGVPVIMFPKGVGEKATEYALLPSCDAMSIDYALDPSWARANISPHCVVQGGLDPLVVAAGGGMMEKAADILLRVFHDVPYVFNLGHGFSPHTPPENVARLVEFIRSGGNR